MKKAFIPLRSNDREVRIYHRYFDYLRYLGYIPVSGDLETGKDLISQIDLLLLPGGGNIGDKDIDSKRNNEIDFKLLDYYYRRNKRVLGICRGLQVINVYFKGSLKKVPNHMNSTHILNDVGNLEVNSYHEEAIDQLGKGLTVNAKSEDGIVEIVYTERIIAFQFHPELLNLREKEALKRLMHGFL